MKRSEFDLIAEQYGKVAAQAADDYGRPMSTYKEPEQPDEDVDKGNIYERLEEFMETVDDDTVDYLRQILTDFEAIMTDINALEAPDQKIGAVDLGIHLNRLAPFSNM